MGKLIKNHWARLIILTASAYQVLASIEGFFWPKLFWDFLTTTLDPVVRPIPILQTINLLLGLLALCWEWPLPIFTAAAKGLQKQEDSQQRRLNGHKATTSNISQIPHNPSKITKFLAAMHRSIEARLMIYPLSSLAALLLYQGTNAGLYYIIGMGVYFWGFTEGEVVMGEPWKLPRPTRGGGGAISRV